MINSQKKSYMQMYLPHTPSENSRLLNFIGFMIIEKINNKHSVVLCFNIKPDSRKIERPAYLTLLRAPMTSP